LRYESFVFYLDNPLKSLDYKFKIEVGWGNGYVAIPNYNLFYGHNYYEPITINNKTILPEGHLEVHGGITFSEKLRPEIYQDYDHTKDYWVFGFDTAHHGDNETNCPKEYVKRQAYYLKEQLDDYGELFHGKEWLKIKRQGKLNKLGNGNKI
jgi:hypothetical protein